MIEAQTISHDEDDPAIDINNIPNMDEYLQIIQDNYTKWIKGQQYYKYDTYYHITIGINGYLTDFKNYHSKWLNESLTDILHTTLK